jgi:hypothetical protein
VLSRAVWGVSCSYLRTCVSAFDSVFDELALNTKPWHGVFGVFGELALDDFVADFASHEVLVHLHEIWSLDVPLAAAACRIRVQGLGSVLPSPHTHLNTSWQGQFAVLSNQTLSVQLLPQIGALHFKHHAHLIAFRAIRHAFVFVFCLG